MLKLDRSKLVMNLGRRYKLVPYLERAIAQFEDPWEYRYEEKEQDTFWHPSGHCLLPPSVLYRIATEPTEERVISGGLRKSFQVGHFWHQWLQYIVLHKLELCNPEDIECRFTKTWGEGPFHGVTGSGDIAPLVLSEWRGIVDFKTTKMSDYNQFKAGRVPEWCAHKYECQMNMYMDGFDEEECLLVAIQKDSPHDMCEILYRRNQPLIDAIYEKFKFVSQAVDEGVVITLLDDDHWPELPLGLGN